MDKVLVIFTYVVVSLSAICGFGVLMFIIMAGASRLDFRNGLSEARGCLFYLFLLIILLIIWYFVASFLFTMELPV